MVTPRGRPGRGPGRTGRRFGSYELTGGASWPAIGSVRIREGGSDMTETASGAASRGSGKRARALTLRRIYTREGVHPYD